MFTLLKLVFSSVEPHEENIWLFSCQVLRYIHLLVAYFVLIKANEMMM